MNLRAVFCSILIFTSAVSSATICARFLTESDSVSNAYITYLGELFDQRVLTHENLLELIQSPLMNPLRGEQDLGSKIHAREIEIYLGQPGLSPEAIAQWAREKDQILQSMRNRRAQTSEATRSIQFKMLRVEGQGKIRSFDLMSTLVTQRTWLRIMGENPARFKGDLDAPIESITWESALEFANRLSKAEGLAPVYDFHGLPEAGTRAENGSLRGHIKITTHEERSGYRLPTRAEINFVSTDRARQKDELYRALGRSKIQDYVWFYDNSDMRTQAVASLLPFVIDGNEFFDLCGNVQIWCSNGQVGGRANWATHREWIGISPAPRVFLELAASFVIGIRLARSSQ